MEIDSEEAGKLESFPVIKPQGKEYFENDYNVLEEVGKGRYGIVRKITEKSTGKILAAKFIRTIKAKDRQQVLDEIKVMNLLKHPKLLQLIGAFESSKEMIMITEYISGGELFERVVADDFTLTEKDSIIFVRQICEAVAYMHQKNLVHMDLKPENIMCQSRSCHQIKVIDFGLTQILNPNTPLRVLFGTPEFVAPEIISFEPIGTESDMWSIGVICYVLLTGLSPFMGDNDAETFANITRAEYEFDEKIYQTISPEAVDFINLLLIKKKELRMSSKDCLTHPWLSQRDENMSKTVLPTDELKKFIIRRKWQKTGNAIRALGRMANLSARNKIVTLTTTEPSENLMQKEIINEKMPCSELDASSEVSHEHPEQSIQIEEEWPLECNIDDVPKKETNGKENIIGTIIAHDKLMNNYEKMGIEPPIGGGYIAQVKTTNQINQKTSNGIETHDGKNVQFANFRPTVSANDDSSEFQHNSGSLEQREADVSENGSSRMKESEINSSVINVHRGCVSSAVKIFEQVKQSSETSRPLSHTNRIRTPAVDMQPHNGRIRKAFEFWNK